MTFHLPDPATPFGERVAQRLRNESIIWLTTIDTKGLPQPTPVWFLWDETTSTFLIYSLTQAKRLAYLQHNPQVALNFDGNGKGGDIIVFTGQAQVSHDDPSADQLPNFVEKYRALLTTLFTTPANFASKYSVALRIHPTAIRGH
ncbi:MAG TPA: TIGR03667 family PPOX class F420-dependent oxidoreductase [Ktedonobacteraceae bacterium]|nr:TIGR03667 family PPOX class F420-dependent oxidoreductase [Ktedonobacteraceae bacterium]